MGTEQKEKKHPDMTATYAPLKRRKIARLFQSCLQNNQAKVAPFCLNGFQIREKMKGRVISELSDRSSSCEAAHLRYGIRQRFLQATGNFIPRGGSWE